ncbi:MAG: methyltransferase [Chitinophagaceae bacterium]
MPNNYFQFKQFTVYQDRCALKVSTDSCVFGAWIAKKTALSQHHINRCLDIGAGTGLLMLMMAQQFAGNIQGVEIDKASYEQATENLKSSPWAHRLQLFHNDIKLFHSAQQYDLIISNPPFFEGDLKSVNTRYNFAKHNDGLSLQDLLEVVNKNLSPNGSFAVLLPYHRMEWFQQLAASSYELFVNETLLMRQSLQHPHFRAVLILQRSKSSSIKKEELVIRRSADVYSFGFIQLLKDYYLHL